jgi:hypothetical protein
MDNTNPDAKPGQLDTIDVELLLLADASRFNDRVGDRAELDAFTDAVFRRIGLTE